MNNSTVHKMKRFVNLYIPVTTCNFKCSYCYITQSGLWKSKVPEFKYDASVIRKGLSKKRLGGICHINICGDGETLIPEAITPIVKELLLEGHYIMIVTNGSISKRFDDLLNLDDELLCRLGFKFSLHYMELIQNQYFMKAFLENVNKVKKSKCSFSIELTPNDELIPYIEDIKKFCLEHFGALCHVTVARDTTKSNIPILTSLSRDEYKKIWSTFESPMFDFKMSTFNVKRTEYCYAGDWSLWVNLGTGETTQCYSSCFKQNIFEDVSKPIKFCAVGKHCNVPHCHNSHALLTLGTIPSINKVNYCQVRDRLTSDGQHWLKDDMRYFLSNRLDKNNHKYNILEVSTNELKRIYYRLQYIKSKVIK